MHHRTPLDFRAWSPWSERARTTFERASGAAWANPLHPSSEGRRAAIWLESMEDTVAQLFGGGRVGFFHDREHALQHVLGTVAGRRVAVAATHRQSVLPFATDVCDVDASGSAHWGNADVVILQYGNEETGVIDHYGGSAVRILDASNALGRTPIDASWDYLIGSARAWGAPVDVAFVVSVRSLEPHPVPALPLVAVAVHELELEWQQIASRATKTAAAMQDFEHHILAAIPDVQFHGLHRVPHIRSLSILHLDAETLMRELDAAGYAVGSGSACVRDGTPSHVLAAMGVVTHGNVRIALPIDTDPEVLPEFATVLTETVHRLRREAGVSDL